MKTHTLLFIIAALLFSSAALDTFSIYHKLQERQCTAE